MNRSTLNRVAQLVVVLGGALSLKFYYSTASVNQLRWILTPTTLLVEFVTGRTFAFESHAGYMSSDHTFLIAASCAGVNFLITVFLMLALRRLWRAKTNVNWRGWMLLPTSASLAYVATIVANTVRISIALQLQKTPLKLDWLDADQIHRLEGIFVYFGFLLLLFVMSERRGRGKNKEWITSLGFLRRCFFPLLIYYGITLGMPLLKGAYGQRNFHEHLFFVVLTPLCVILFIVALHYFKSQVYRTGAKRAVPTNQEFNAN